ncbi:MAG: hypothetical protein ACLRRT_12350 [Ruthenibacterium lactatiformans]
MTEQGKQRQIDALVERIDAFMKNGGAACASPAARAKRRRPLRRLLRRSAAEACNAPAKRAGHKSR